MDQNDITGKNKKKQRELLFVQNEKEKRTRSNAGKERDSNQMKKWFPYR